MAPAVVGVSAAQISLLINTIFASFLAPGSVSWLYFANRLLELPLGIVGVAMGTVLIPEMTRAVRGGEVSQGVDLGGDDCGDFPNAVHRATGRHALALAQNAVVD